MLSKTSINQGSMGLASIKRVRVIDEVKGVIEGVRVTLQDFNLSSINGSNYCYVQRGKAALGSHSGKFVAYHC